MRNDELSYAGVLQNFRTELSHEYLSSGIEKALCEKGYIQSFNGKPRY